MKLFHLDWENGHKHKFHSRLTFPGLGTGDSLAKGDDVFDAALVAFQGGFFHHVAEIEGGDLNFAFRSTQNIDEAWGDAPAEGVKPVGSGPFRSTSVGDIIEQDGVYSLVSSFGFKELQGFLRTA